MDPTKLNYVYYFDFSILALFTGILLLISSYFLQ